MVDAATATTQDLDTWRRERHIGSPSSIIFLTSNQRQLWGELRVLLLADYSTGLRLHSTAQHYTVLNRTTLY